MRHRVSGRTLGRRPDQRLALFRGLATSLIDSGRIVTTLEKAKELRRFVEPLVTKAKKGDLNSRRLVAGKLYRKESVAKLFSEIAPALKDRAGGYTRILKYKKRQGDAAQTAIIEFVGVAKDASAKSTKKTVAKKKAPAKKAASASTEKKTAKAAASAEKKAAASAVKKKAPAKKKAVTKKASKKS
ncbi:MAG: 50S ribosomal protein L17 [Bdellovibrionota bacterium]